MNIDLIIKLARLANENPNENESNAAAKKVCQLIKAANYNFSQIQTKQTEPQVKTWNDVRRSTEPEFKSKPPTYPGNPFDFSSNQYDFFSEFFRQNAREDFQGGRRSGKSYKQKQQEQYYSYSKKEEPLLIIDFDNRTREYILSNKVRISEIEYQMNKNKYKINYKDKRPLNCTKCGKEYMSGYIGNLFVCNNCHWDKYQKESK